RSRIRFPEIWTGPGGPDHHLRDDGPPGGGARRGPGDGAPLSRGGSGGQVDPRFSGNDPREGVSGGAPVETAVRKQPADGPVDGSGEKGGGTAPACLHPRRRAGDFGEAPYGIRSPDAGKR